MRTAILHFLSPLRDKDSRIVKNLETGAAARADQVDVFDGKKDMSGVRLTMYDYVAVVVPVAGLLSGKIPVRVSEVLASAGTVSGKKGCALVVKGGFMAAKTCRNLMRAMEKEGILLDYSEIIFDAEHASAVGKKIG